MKNSGETFNLYELMRIMYSEKSMVYSYFFKVLLHSIQEVILEDLSFCKMYSLLGHKTQLDHIRRDFCWRHLYDLMSLLFLMKL